MSTDIQVYEQDGQLWTTSREVAAKFRRNHKHVLKAVELAATRCSAGFSRTNFRPSTYQDDRGKEQPMFLLSRGGFSMVIMGFTGEKAFAWKEKFIAAFDLMEKRVLQLSRQIAKRGELEWQDARQEGKTARHELAAVLADFVAYARAQGSVHANRYFMNITRMVYRAFFGVSPAVERELRHAIRDHLDARQLRDLATVEERLALEMDEQMDRGVPYKAIFVGARVFVEALAGMFRPSPLVPLGMASPLAVAGDRPRARAVLRLPLIERRVGNA